MADNIAWVLGAGFSYSLGAPLLPDLFTPESARRVQVHYGDHFNAAKKPYIPTWIAGLCQAGTYKLPHSKPIERQWQHAEEFIEKLELAAQDPILTEVLADFIKKVETEAVDWDALSGRARARRDDEILDLAARVVGGEVNDIVEQALRFLAAEICLFLEGANLKQERWKPYVKWAEALTEADTVITFNYDRVLEKLQENGARLAVPSPYDVRTVQQPRIMATAYKLHGSVDWQLGKDNQIRPLRSPTAALTCPFDQLAIATPGPKKREMVENNGPLSPVWDAAGAAIRNADTIVFIGYRIPPSDALTRDWLVEQIRANGRLGKATGPRRPPNVTTAVAVQNLPAENPLVVHTVLGDDVNHADSRRLKGFLEGADSQGRIVVKQWPMFAEDFLAIVDSGSLVKAPQ